MPRDVAEEISICREAISKGGDDKDPLVWILLAKLGENALDLYRLSSGISYRMDEVPLEVARRRSL